MVIHHGRNQGKTASAVDALKALKSHGLVVPSEEIKQHIVKSFSLTEEEASRIIVPRQRGFSQITLEEVSRHENA